MTYPSRLLVLVVAAALTTACSNFRPREEGDTLRGMTHPLRWAAYDGPELPPPRQFPSVTPIPGGAIVFGGRGAIDLLGEAWRWDGARWQALPAEGAPRPRMAHAAAWTGDALCIWGGEAAGEALDDGACWEAASNRWRPISSEGAPTARGAMASAFTGREWILWGGRDADGNDFADGARYDPTTRRWSALPDGGPRARHRAFSAVSPDGARVLIWGGAGEALALGAEDAAILDLASSRWIPVDLDGAPAARTAPFAVEVPGGLVAVGSDAAAVFEWSTGRWRPVDPAPTAGRWGVTVVAAPSMVVAWGGRDTAGLHGDGAVLDVATGRWTLLPEGGPPEARADAVGVPDGRQVLVLWGSGAAGLRVDGFALR